MNETWIEDGECLPETLDWFGFDYYDYTKDFQNKFFDFFYSSCRIEVIIHSGANSIMPDFC